MNISIDMGEILVKAWKITWKYKILWIFGILAGCASNNGNNFNYNNSFGSGTSYGPSSSGSIPDPFKRFQDMQFGDALRSFFSQYLAIIAIVIVSLCILWFVLYFLGVVGKTGLIKGVGKADAGAEGLGFGELWNESLPYFWRLLGLALLVGLPFFLVTIVLVVILLFAVYGFVANGGSSSGAIASLIGALGIFIPAICCLGLARLVVGLIVEQAQNAIVVEDKRLLEGLGRGWNIFKTSFLTIILIGIILGVVGLIFGFIVAIPLLLIVIPMIAAVVMAGSNSSVAMAPLIVAGLCCVAYVPVLLLLGGIERTYIQSVWTLTYLRLTGLAPATPAAPIEIPNAS